MIETAAARGRQAAVLRSGGQTADARRGGIGRSNGIVRTGRICPEDGHLHTVYPEYPVRYTIEESDPAIILDEAAKPYAGA